MKITIITVARNAAATIGDTMASVAAQRHDDIEHLVIDGASTDDTAAIVAAGSTQNTRFYSEPDNGLYDAMNKGLALATGDMIGFLNADDFYSRIDAADLIAEAAVTTRCDAVVGSVAIVDAWNADHLTRAYPSRPFSSWMLRFGHMPPHPGFYATRSAFDRVGRFDTALHVGADFEWMVRFFAVHDLNARPIPQTIVTLREGGLSNSGFGSRKIINAEAVSSLRRHGIATAAPVVWSKYLAKAAQFAVSAYEWPAADDVRWPKA